ncbi:MAG: glycine zipper domain-containing protein [Rhizomicrobium sp.]
MKHFAKLAAACAIALTASTVGAAADACSGRSHDTGTALGAGGGALIGGLASHSIAGAVVGGVAGGFAGNAIARSEDCNRGSSHYRSRDRDSYYIDRHGRRHYR